MTITTSGICAKGLAHPFTPISPLIFISVPSLSGGTGTPISQISEARRQRVACPRCPGYRLAEPALGSSWGGGAAGRVKAPRLGNSCLLKIKIPNFRTYTEGPGFPGIRPSPPRSLSAHPWSLLQGPENVPSHIKLQLFLCTSSAARYCASFCGSYEGRDLPRGLLSHWGDKKCSLG